MNFTLPKTFNKTCKVAQSNLEGCPEVEVTINFTLADDLTSESVLAKLMRPEVIKVQNAARSKWQKEGVRPSTVINVTIGNDERKYADPSEVLRKMIAKAKGIAVEDVTDEMLIKAKELFAMLGN